MSEALGLDLDPRQRAMLQEMGIVLWDQARLQPAPAVPAPAKAPQRPAVAVAAPTAATTQEHAASASERASQPIAAPVSPVATPRAALLAPASPPAPSAARPAQASSFMAEPLAEGIAQMDWPTLRDAVANCRACGLCQDRTNTVFGVGAETAQWMVVGEAPGENEDLQGEPFVGNAGQLLDQMLRAIGLTRATSATNATAQTAQAQTLQPAYIANVVKCRPPGNRNPHPDEIAMCAHYLRRQVQLLKPRIILAVGRFAANTLLHDTVPDVANTPVGKLRGQVHSFDGIPVVVSYHPAYLLRNLPEKAKAWADLCLAKSTFDQQPLGR